MLYYELQMVFSKYVKDQLICSQIFFSLYIKKGNKKQ